MTLHDSRLTTANEDRLEADMAAAMALADAAADCNPRHRVRLLERLADQWRPGAPVGAGGGGQIMAEARTWASMASGPEVKAYALACWSQMSEADRKKFLEHLYRESAPKANEGG